MSGLEDLVAELMEPLGGVSIRRMFGGRGVFKDGLMFALLSSRGVFYLKADEKTVAGFEREGCEQFAAHMKGRKAAMPYWRAPERLFDEPDEFAEWARAAFDAAVRTKTAKPTGRKAKIAAKAAVSNKAPKRRTGG